MKNIHRKLNGYLFSASFLSDDGSALDIDSATLTIKDGAGTLLHSNLACAMADALTCALDDVLDYDIYTFEWTAHQGSVATLQVEQVRLVEAPYYEQYQLKAFAGSDLPADVDLDDLRNRIESKLESLCKRAFRTTPCRERLQAYDGYVLASKADILEVVSVIVDGSVVECRLTPAGYISPINAGWRDGALVDVYYTYGAEMNPDIKQACLLLALDAVNSNRPNVTSETNEFGTTRFTVGGIGANETNSPEANEIIRRHGLRRYSL